MPLFSIVIELKRMDFSVNVTHVVMEMQIWLGRVCP